MKLDAFGSREIALMMAASSGDPAAPDVRRLMGQRINWRELTRLAVESHATQGVWEVVSKFPGLPRESESLQAVAVLNDFRRIHIRSITARVVRELSAHGIETMALKGAALLAGAVARPAPRTMTDIDLLVISGSPEKAWEICRAAGWTLVDSNLNEHVYRKHHHLPPLRDPDGVRIGLELHRALLPDADRLAIDVNEIVRRSRTVGVGDVTVRVPSVEDLLLHLCVHYAWCDKMGRGTWRACADAHAIISDPSFDWNRFVAVIPSRRARMSCYWTLRLCSAIADLPVPPDVLKRLDASNGGRMAALLERHFTALVADRASRDTISDRVQRWLWLEAMGEHPNAREADALWNFGSLDMPEATKPAAGPTRGALTAAVRTGAYFMRLLSRG